MDDPYTLPEAVAHSQDSLELFEIQKYPDLFSELIQNPF